MTNEQPWVVPIRAFLGTDEQQIFCHKEYKHPRCEVPFEEARFSGGNHRVSVVNWVIVLDDNQIAIVWQYWVTSTRLLIVSLIVLHHDEPYSSLKTPPLVYSLYRLVIVKVVPRILKNVRSSGIDHKMWIHASLYPLGELQVVLLYHSALLTD